MYFRAASKHRVYSLDPYKILDLLGDMGGILEIGMALGLVMTFAYVKNSYERSILTDTYQVQRYNENSREYYKSSRLQKVILSGDAQEEVEPDLKLTSTDDSQEGGENQGQVKTQNTIKSIKLNIGKIEDNLRPEIRSALENASKKDNDLNNNSLKQQSTLR